MRSKISWLAMQMGVVAGMRSAAPHALLGLATAKRRKISLLQTGLVGLALLELVGDKLPFTPLRTKPLPLSGRTLSGGLAGFTLARRRKVNPLTATLLGAAAALASSYAFSRLRLAAVDKLHVPKLAAALMEDAAALSLGRRVALNAA